MKEKNQIDEIIKNGLKNFEPDFNDLHWDEMETMLDKEHPVPGSVFTKYRKYFYSFSALLLLLFVGYFIGSYFINNKNISNNFSSAKSGNLAVSSSNSSSKTNSNFNSNINTSSKSDLETVVAENTITESAVKSNEGISEKAQEKNALNTEALNIEIPSKTSGQNADVLDIEIPSNTNNGQNTDVLEIEVPSNTNNSQNTDVLDIEVPSNTNNGQNTEVLEIEVPSNTNSNQNTKTLDINNVPSNNNEQNKDDLNNNIEGNKIPKVETPQSIDELADLNTGFLKNIREENTELAYLDGKFLDMIEEDEVLVALEAKKAEPSFRSLPKMKRPKLLGLGIGALGSLEMNYVDQLNNSQLGNSQGVLVEYNFGQIFSLETAFILSNKIYQSKNVNNVPYVVGNIENSQVKYSMIEIPLLARFKFRKNKAFQPHIGTGHSVYIPRKEKYFFVSDLEVEQEYENDYTPESETENFESFEDPRDPRAESEGSNIFEDQDRTLTSTGDVESEISALPMEQKSGPFWGIVNLSVGFDWRIARNHKLRLEGQFKSSINKLSYDLRVSDYPVSNEKHYKSLGARLSYVLNL